MIYYVGDSPETTWAIGDYSTISEAAEARDLRPWRLVVEASPEQAWKRWGYVVRFARMAVEAEKRYTAQQAGRIGGKAGTGVAKIRANFAESLKKARAARIARILDRNRKEQGRE